jgi:hypothetical protein
VLTEQRVAVTTTTIAPAAAPTALTVPAVEPAAAVIAAAIAPAPAATVPTRRFVVKCK